MMPSTVQAVASATNRGDLHDGVAPLPVTKTLAEFAANFDAEKLPPQVRHQVARCLVNWAGCAIGGAGHLSVSTVLATLGPFLGPAQASVLGRRERTDILHAALLNGISSHVLDFDDTHHATLVHPSGPVLAALLALAEYKSIRGRDFVAAVAIGIEVECRVALGICPAHYDIGWHVTSTAGVFGAAAAVGRALGLSTHQMQWAFGIAATQASGLREMFGTMCKGFHPGRAAQAGLTAALLAQGGFTSSERAIEAPRGFAHVTSTDVHLGDSVKDLGLQWVIMDNAFKPYACGLVVHPVIDGCIALHHASQLQPDNIVSVSLRVNPLVQELTGKSSPQTGLEGKFSVYHCAAVALIEGVGSSKQYTDASVQNPVTASLRKRVSINVDQKIRVDEAVIEISMVDGSVVTHHVEHALGSLEKPMSDDDLERKFVNLVSDTLPEAQWREALDQCWKVEQLSSFTKLASNLSLQ